MYSLVKYIILKLFANKFIYAFLNMYSRIRLSEDQPPLKNNIFGVLFG